MAIPNNWKKLSGTFQIRELTSQHTTLKHLERGTKYIYCVTSGTLVIPYPNAEYADSNVDVLYNDGTWTNIKGSVNRILTNFVGSTLSNGSLKIVMQAGQGLTNLILYDGQAISTDTLWYGYELNEASTSPDVTRIAGSVANMTLHASLPVQSLMKGCVINDSGVVQYYLKSDDWSKKADGTASNLDGTDGQLMVEVPKFYHKIDNPSSGIYQHKFSLSPIVGFVEIPLFYVSPSEAQIQRSTLKLASVRNLSADYRGGNNNAAWDAGDNTLLGKPASSISLTNFRIYARTGRSNKWNVLPYRHSMLIYDLFVCEYATLNSQKAVDGTLTGDGYKRGGLGAGVTTAISAEWTAFSASNPFITAGASDSLGNASGSVSVTITNFGGAGVNRSFAVPRYRGIENIFGHLWEWQDGVIVYHQTAVEGNLHKFYTCDIPANFADGPTITNYDYRGNLPAEGFIKAVTHDVKGIFIPKTVGGSDATYFCDYYYTPAVGVGTWIGVIRGGDAAAGSLAGFVSVSSTNGASYTRTFIGSRFCFIP